MTCKHLMRNETECVFCERDRLRALLTQAPIAKVTVQESLAGQNAPDDVSVSLYAPGLPPGEYDLYLMPDDAVDGKRL